MLMLNVMRIHRNGIKGFVKYIQCVKNMLYDLDWKRVVFFVFGLKIKVDSTGCKIDLML